VALRTVKQAGGAGYTTIAAAVAACAASDVVEIQDSATYNESITFPGGVAPLTVRAGSGHAPVLSGAGGKAFAFRWVAEPGVRIQGLEITGYNTGAAVLQGSSYGCIAEWCYIHDCDGPAMDGAYGLGWPNHALLIRCTILRTRGGLVVVSGNACSAWNNLIVPQAGYAGINYPSDSNGFFWHNTVIVNGAVAAIDVDNGVGAAECRGNIAVNLSAGAGSGIDSGTNDYNCAFNFGSAFPRSTGAHDITSDPLLVGASDYRLTLDSPCRGAADPASPVTDDLLGTARPQGQVRDLGCYEMVVRRLCRLNGVDSRLALSALKRELANGVNY
jgi:hypothetical protein